MTVTVQDVMRHVRNHFVSTRFSGDWQLRSGRLLPEGICLPGEWIAILQGPGAGVWQLDEFGAISLAVTADWTGCICLLQPPAGFLRVCEEISAWQKDHPDPAMTQERFGEYSRTQQNARWTEVFAPTLRPYTKMFPEVDL